MRIAIAGGGPGGLYLSILLKRLDPAHEVVVTSATRPTTRSASASCSATRRWPRSRPPTRSPTRRSRAAFVRWSEIDVHFRGEVVTCGGHGFSRARPQGAARTSCSGARRSSASTCASGTRSSDARRRPGRRRRRREQHAARALRETSGPTLDRRRATYAWFGTDARLRGLHVHHRRDAAGRRAGARVSRTATRCSTFIVETTDALPLDKAACEELFGYRADREPHALDQLRHGPQRRLAATGTSCCSATPRTPRTSRSAPGTKLAMEDAISLAWAVREGDIDAYEAERRPIVETTQRAAQGSLEWFEGIGRYVHQDPRTFAFNLLTRSRRITYGELRMRDPEFVAALRRRAADVHAVPAARAGAGQPRRRLADGHVLVGRRHAGRLPPRAPRRAGDRRRRAGDDRDDLHVAPTGGSRRAAAACTATSTRRRGSGSSTSCTRTRARRSARSSGTPGARARRSCCGRARTSRCRGQLAADRAVAAAVPAPASARCRAR